MKIAIIGAGFCGLATAWYLSQKSTTSITLFDAYGIGKGASGVAAGLLHPYVGAHSKLNWRAFEGMAATNELIKVAENALGFPVAFPLGLLRPAVTPEQVSDFTLSAHSFPSDINWWEKEKCQSEINSLLPHPAIFIKSGMTVDCESYLQGLWKACSNRGVKLELTKIEILSQLNTYDCIVVAIGAATDTLPELSHLKLQKIKGQVLELAWPTELPPLPFPINSQAYLLMNRDRKTCIAGATYERKFTDPGPNQEAACNEILPKINAYIKGFDAPTIISCRASLRAITFSRRPMIMQAYKNCWVFTGMASKGLLYHALCAKELASSIVA